LAETFVYTLTPCMLQI